MKSGLAIAIQQTDGDQRQLLASIVKDCLTSPDLIQLDDFTELRSLSSRRRFDIIYVGLEKDSNPHIQWLHGADDDVVGLLNWKWSPAELSSYIESGLYDFLVKPYQPGKIEKQLEHRRQLSEIRSGDY